MGHDISMTLQELQPRRKWTVIPWENNRFDSKRFVPLAQIARVVRGIATGANNFFVLSNVFLCVYPELAIVQSETALKALLAVLNSAVSKETLRHVGRSYDGGDTIKLEPRELDRLPVLNPITLGEVECEHLALLFERLCAANSGDDEQAIRRAIDEMVETISRYDLECRRFG